MILKIELENFFSIKERICIDFRAAKINTKRARDLEYNTFDWNGTKILKSIGLFGPNASGKSNVLKSIYFCCMLILESHLYNEGKEFNFEPFKFNGYDKKPSRFSIAFICEDVEYEYSFELTKKEILKESLYSYPKGRKSRIFVRDETKNKHYIFANRAFVKPSDVANSTTKLNLFLSRASSMKRELAQKLYRYFLSTFLLSIIPVSDSETIASFFKKYKNVLLRALAICDSDICDIKMKKGPLENAASNRMPIVTGGEALRFKTYHKISPDISFDMDTDESNGTRKLFYMMLSILDVVRNRKALMADEFDSSLHPQLAEFIIDLIHASPVSQFLFTTHNVGLLNMSKFRPDQIVFVNKKEDGSSEVYSLYDYRDFRDTMDAVKAYMQGRFDAVPYIDTSVSTLRKLLED